MYKKIGKASDYILEYQPQLLSGIESHIKDERIFENSYLASPIRISCLVCNEKIQDTDFLRNGIEFSFCTNCGHVNGKHRVSEDLADATYNSQTEQSMNYEKLYIMSQEKFNTSVSKIYVPKASFIKEALQRVGEDLNLSILDYGTGAGHMVKALRDVGFTTVEGIDPMKTTIEFGKTTMGIAGLNRVQIQDSLMHLSQTSAQLVTMICTLPHVTDQDATLSTMLNNNNIKYTFQKLPMFSLGSMLDVISPKTNSRVLSGAHTHLYTEKSLSYIESKYNLKRIAEWRFGADILDLYRHIQISLHQLDFSEKFKSEFTSKFTPLIDDLQRTIDSNNFASEIHVLWELPKD